MWSDNPLIQLNNFPYFPQGDNGIHGWRQCQTSSIAMCLAYLKVPGIKDDLDYLRILSRFGDTTMQSAHSQALDWLGVPATFRTNLTRARVTAELRAGRPVPAGILHKGPYQQPGGGGHWVVVTGQTASGYIVQDPYGEAAVLSGGWCRVGGSSGRNQRYSFKGMVPRWFVEGDGSGWGWTFP